MRHFIRYIMIFLGLTLATCSPLISARPSDLILVTREARVLSQSQVSALPERMKTFSRTNNLTFGMNQSPGEGDFSLEMTDQQKTTSYLIVSPFKSSEFLFLFYIKKNTKASSIQKSRFIGIIQTATIP